MYPGQLKKLTDLGYEVQKSRELIIKHRGNLSKVITVEL